MKKILPFLIGIVTILSGCAVNPKFAPGYTAEVKGGFENSEKLYLGVSRWPTDPISLNLWEKENLSQKCDGLFIKGLITGGQIHNGSFRFKCTNGVEVSGEWYSPAGQDNLVGKGSGQNGEVFHIIAGTQLNAYPELERELLQVLRINNKGKADRTNPEKQESIATGTGFFISNDGYLLTNSHVIEGSSNISIILNGRSVAATLVDHDSNNDIALLKVDEEVEGLPIELKKKTKQGTEIAVLGYPNIGLQGNEKKATFGYINANSGLQGDTRYFQISAPIQPGNSGSPMVNDQGVVIGIASASLNQSAAIRATGTLAQNVNYAVKIAYAMPMLINHGVDYIEPVKQKASEKTELIESISNSVVLVVAE